MFEEIRQLSALELSHAFKAQQLSPVETTRCLLEQIPAQNQALNMLYDVKPEAALSMAKASERRWLKGEPNSAFDGVATTIKDALPSRGDISYRGSAAHDTAEPCDDWEAPCVRRIKEAGMVPLGKNTMPDFGILASGYSSHHGITRNPWNLNKNTGGSSSGAAASVASGLTPVAIGTDIVGSIRLPASFCGLVGHKPSQGRVPFYPPNAPTLVAGPLSRTVSDAAMFLSILSQPDRRDYTALAPPTQDFYQQLQHALPGKRIGLLTDMGFGPTVDPDVEAAVIEAAKVFEDLGHTVERLSSPFSKGADECAELFYKQRCYSEFSQQSKDIQQRSPHIANWTRDAESITAPMLYNAMNEMRAMREKMMGLFQHIDYLLLPSVAIPAFDAELPAPDINRLFAPWSNVFIFNMTEQPACSINCGFSREQLPIGLQIVGQRFDDAGVLQLAYQFEKQTPVLTEFPVF